MKSLDVILDNDIRFNNYTNLLRHLYSCRNILNVKLKKKSFGTCWSYNTSNFVMFILFTYRNKILYEFKIKELVRKVYYEIRRMFYLYDHLKEYS